MDSQNIGKKEEIMYLVGVGVSLFGLVICMIFKGTNISIFLNPGVFIIFLGILMGVVVATSSYKTLIVGLNSAISKGYAITEAEKKRAIGLFHLLSKTSIYVGIMSGILGTINAFSYLQDKEIFSHAMLTSMVGLITGIFLAVAFFEPVAFILKYRRGEIQ